MKTGIMASVVSAFLVAILAQPQQVLVVLFGFGFTGLVLGGALAERFSPTKTLLVGSVASVISTAILMVVSMIFLKVNPLKMNLSVMKDAMDSVIDMYAKFGMTKQQLASLRVTFKQTMDLFKIVLPATLVLSSVLNTFLNLWVARLVLNRLGYKTDPLPGFRDWSFPWYLALFFVAGTALNATQSRHHILLLAHIGINIQFLLSIAYVIQGIAIAWWFFDRYNVAKMVRILLTFFVISNPMFQLVATWLGVLDPWLDLRRIRRPVPPVGNGTDIDDPEKGK